MFAQAGLLASGSRSRAFPLIAVASGVQLQLQRRDRPGIAPGSLLSRCRHLNALRLITASSWMSMPKEDGRPPAAPRPSPGNFLKDLDRRHVDPRIGTTGGRRRTGPPGSAGLEQDRDSSHARPGAPRTDRPAWETPPPGTPSPAASPSGASSSGNGRPQGTRPVRPRSLRP